MSKYMKQYRQQLFFYIPKVILYIPPFLFSVMVFMIKSVLKLLINYKSANKTSGLQKDIKKWLKKAELWVFLCLALRAVICVWICRPSSLWLIAGLQGAAA